MVGAAVQRRLTWRTADVAELLDETSSARSVVMIVPDWPGHQAGQHLDVRLTAADGYQAQRSYSIASPPESERIAITVERIDDGEVSPFLAGELRIGDRLELRGPIGGYFVWDVSLGGPILLIAGGSGVCPLMAMLRHRAARRSVVPARLLYSARSFDDVIYRDEIDRLAADRSGLEVAYTLTRAQPEGWSGYDRRIDSAMLADFGWSTAERPLIFVCGPTPLVESVAESLVQLGHEPARIKTERFGPTGG
ncbi:MAG TPA: ferredoxin reductase [Candidatus Acidoferrales bacterium]|nr:ferredoxin reductase [Candidatus Acidoferrales bacterium]